MTIKQAKKTKTAKPIQYKNFAAVLRAKAAGKLPRGTHVTCGKGAEFRVIIPGQAIPALDMGVPIPALFAVLKALGIKAAQVNT